MAKATASFSESIIIPLETYKKLCSKQPSEPPDLKRDATSETPEVILNKLDRKTWEEKQTGKKQTTNLKQRKFADLANKFAGLGVRNPFLEQILQKYVYDFQSKIDWDETSYELILDQEILPKTNIIRSLHFLLTPENFDYNRPPGAERLAGKLKEIGVPAGWLHNVTRESPDRTRNIPPHPLSLTTTTRPRGEIAPHPLLATLEGIKPSPHITPLARSTPISSSYYTTPRVKTASKDEEEEEEEEEEEDSEQATISSGEEIQFKRSKRPQKPRPPPSGLFSPERYQHPLAAAAAPVSTKKKKKHRKKRKNRSVPKQSGTASPVFDLPANERQLRTPRQWTAYDEKQWIK